MAKAQRSPGDRLQAIASEVLSYLQDAVGDIASDMLRPASGFRDDAWDKRIKQAKKNGCQDLQGWLADELYNDADTLQDLLGDRIFEAVNRDEALFQKVLDLLSERAHPALKKACEALKQ
jgi:hypothetical protein